jgi:hypothetical protein
MRHIKRWLFIVPLLFCVACTTIEDFKTMSPEERAEEVCSATSASHQRRAALMNLNDRIAAQETLLTNGYRIYEDCPVLPVYVPAVAYDCTGKTGNDLDNCQKKNTPAHTEYQRVCRQARIPIDYNYESGILRNLRMAKDDQQQIQDQLNSDCIEKAKLLSPTEAYSAYLKNAEP